MNSIRNLEKRIVDAFSAVKNEIIVLKESFNSQKDRNSSFEKKIEVLDNRISSIREDIEELRREKDDYEVREIKKDIDDINKEIKEIKKDNKFISYSGPLNSKGEWQTKPGDKGDYGVTVTVSDGKETVSKVVKIIVE